jgi:hypothetical protein
MENKYITEEYVLSILEEVCKEMNYDIPKIRFPPLDKFLKKAKTYPINKAFIKAGVYKDFEKEYENFAGMESYVIVFNIELANKYMCRFEEDEIDQFIRFVMAHELTHINNWIDDPIENENAANKAAKKFIEKDIYVKIASYIYGNLRRKVKENINKTEV